MERVDVSDVIYLLSQGNSYKRISEILMDRFPNSRGFSLNSVKRFCYKHGISSRVSKEFIESEVREAVVAVSFTNFSLCV